MEKVMEYVRLIIMFLWQENGGAVVSTAIASIIAVCSHTDWAQRNKGFVLFAWFLQIVLNIPCVFLSNAAWYERLYAGILMVYGVVKFCETMAIKVSKKTYLQMDELGYPGQTAVFDDKEMFRKAQEGAAQGIPMYIYNLGCFYRDGRGTRVNLNKSRYYFEQLCNSSEQFWREEGRKGLEGVNKMIAERNENLRNTAKAGAGNMVKDFFGFED